MPEEKMTAAQKRAAEGLISALDATYADTMFDLLSDAGFVTDEPKTLQTIADEFGISRERVRQIEANLLKKLRKQLEKDMPDIQDFLDGDDIVAAGPGDHE